MAACVEVGLEGLVAKRLDSIYRSGERSRDWVKAKCPVCVLTMRRADFAKAVGQSRSSAERIWR
jgi:ATP-dependent DNA ligase